MKCCPRAVLAVVVVVVLGIAFGCDGQRDSVEVIVKDLSGVPAYTGDWMPVGGNESWKRPGYAPGAHMNPPMHVNGTWDSVILIRGMGANQTVEIDGQPILTGRFRSAVWTTTGCASIGATEVNLNGQSYGPLHRDSWLLFTPDRKQWALAARDQAGVHKVYVNGVLKLEMASGSPGMLSDWMKTPAGQWEPLFRHSTGPEIVWTDLSGKTVPMPAGWGPRPPSAVKAQVKLDNRAGPTTVLVNGKAVGTYAFVLHGIGVGPDGRGARYGIDAKGRLVMYDVDGEGQLVRVSMPQ